MCMISDKSFSGTSMLVMLRRVGGGFCIDECERYKKGENREIRSKKSGKVESEEQK